MNRLLDDQNWLQESDTLSPTEQREKNQELLELYRSNLYHEVIHYWRCKAGLSQSNRMHQSAMWGFLGGIVGMIGASAYTMWWSTSTPVMFVLLEDNDLKK